MDDLKLKQEQERGWKAQELIDNELLSTALTAIEDEVIKQWEACPARDAEGKEALWQLYKTSKKFRSLLFGYIQTGKMAADTLTRYEESRIKQLTRKVMNF
jgi:hypothetical protein